MLRAFLEGVPVTGYVTPTEALALQETQVGWVIVTRPAQDCIFCGAVGVADPDSCACKQCETLSCKHDDRLAIYCGWCREEAAYADKSPYVTVRA